MAEVPDFNEMVAAIIAAANAQVPAAPAAAAGAPFSLLPGEAFNTALDYNKASELKIFCSATTGMEDKFDMKEEHLRVFLDTLKEHVRTYNWASITIIPDANAVNRDLTTHYGQLTRENIRTHALGYINTQTRNAQCSMMMYKYLSNSLTDDAKLMMLALSDQYKEGDLPVGSLFLKAIIGRASIDTKAKVLLLRESVSHLHVKIADMKFDIRLFNQYVSELVAALAGRGQETSELVMHLFKAYEQVPDQQFNRYIETVRDRYEEDDPDDEVTAIQLMRLAMNKFDLLTHRNALSYTDDTAEKIVALEARMKALQDEDKKKNETNRRKARPQDAWKYVAPAAGQPTTKKVGKKTYHYCPFHKQWTIHSPAECLLDPSKEKGPVPDKKSEGDHTAADKLIINKAYHALIHDYGSDEDEG